MYTLLPMLILLCLPFIFQTNSSLMMMWIMLEISSIMFVCLSISEEEMKNKESFLMYFLIQSFSSAMLLLCIFSTFSLTNRTMLETSNMVSIFIITLISMKIAMAPMHFWLIKMSKLISWFVMSILLTWQKIMPLTFLCMFSMNYALLMLCLISLTMGILSQIKLTSLKQLMAFSSISHLGWMVFPVIESSLTTLLYLTIYSLIVLPMMAMLLSSNYLYLFNQMNFYMMPYFGLVIMSLSGIPPLLGFLLKWITLNYMIPSIVLMMTFCLMACMSFYIYIRMAYKMFMMTPYTFKHKSPKPSMKSIWMVNLIMPIVCLIW